MSTRWGGEVSGDSDLFGDSDQCKNGPPPLRLGQFAFALGAIALGLQAAEIALVLLANFGGLVELQHLIEQPAWGLCIGTPLTWSAAVSAYLLLAFRPDPSWRRRAALLALMNSIDLLFWAADNGRYLGFRIPELELLWVRYVGGVLQWVELSLYASLAAECCAGLGREDARTAARLVRSSSIVGVGLWFVVLMGATLWSAWPPAFIVRSIEVFLCRIASMALLGMTAFRVVLLCALATRTLGTAIRARRAAESDHELLRSPSDAFDEWPDREDDPFR